MPQQLITLSRNPLYLLTDYIKFNLTYEGGRQFICEYLERYDCREDPKDFEKRKKMTYNPGFAAEALDEVKNSVFQRMSEVTRSGGTKTYQKAVEGHNGGVDLCGSGMNYFMGQKALPETLKFGRCGVYVDRPAFNPYGTLAEYTTTPNPYLTVYKPEDILNWRTFYYNNELQYNSVLLREHHWEFDPVTGLPLEPKERFRLVTLRPEGGVRVTFMEQYMDGKELRERTTAIFDIPGLSRIPFIPLDIGKSLLNDVSDYQIGLLNLASSDLSYAINSNFQFYVEPYDPKTENIHAKNGPKTTFDAEGNPVEGEATENSRPERRIGSMHGVRYPMEANAPAFIHPSSEPLTVSMLKQKQMREEIRHLLNLSVSSVTAQQSADSKAEDKSSLEAGLSAIGWKMQLAESQIALVWAMYEAADTDKIVVSYPTTYSLKTDDERLDESVKLQGMKGAAPSRTYQKKLGIRIARTLLGGRVSQTEMETIEKEIDSAPYTTSDATEIQLDIQSGLVDATTASNARGYDGETVVPKAQAERIQRLKESAIAQAPGGGSGQAAARGNDGEPTDTSAKDEKAASQNPANKVDNTKLVRGEGK